MHKDAATHTTSAALRARARTAGTRAALVTARNPPTSNETSSVYDPNDRTDSVGRGEQQVEQVGTPQIQQQAQGGKAQHHEARDVARGFQPLERLRLFAGTVPPPVERERPQRRRAQQARAESSQKQVRHHQRPEHLRLPLPLDAVDHDRPSERAAPPAAAKRGQQGGRGRRPCGFAGRDGQRARPAPPHARCCRSESSDSLSVRRSASSSSHSSTKNSAPSASPRRCANRGTHFKRWASRKSR